MIGVDTLWNDSTCDCGRHLKKGDRRYFVGSPGAGSGMARCEDCIAPLFQRRAELAHLPDPLAADSDRRQRLARDRAAIVARTWPTIRALVAKQIAVGSEGLSAADQLALDTVYADLDELTLLGLDRYSGDIAA